MLYDTRALGKHGLRKLLVALTWTNVYLSFVGFCVIHIKATTLKMLMKVINRKQMKWIHLKSMPHPPGVNDLTHWGRMMHICGGNLPIIAPDNGLLPGWHQAIIWTNAGVLLIGPLWTNFSVISFEIHTFSFMKRHLKMLSAKWRPFVNTVLYWAIDVCLQEVSINSLSFVGAKGAPGLPGLNGSPGSPGPAGAKGAYQVSSLNTVKSLI